MYSAASIHRIESWGRLEARFDESNLRIFRALFGLGRSPIFLGISTPVEGGSWLQRLQHLKPCLAALSSSQTGFYFEAASL